MSANDQAETLAEEFARICEQYDKAGVINDFLSDEGHEAWNLIAGFAFENREAILRALTIVETNDRCDELRKS